jgi:hypothetical protein
MAESKDLRVPRKSSQGRNAFLMQLRLESLLEETNDLDLDLNGRRFLSNSRY